MKKKEVTRNYKFPDANLVSIANEKIAFIRRDATQFADFGVTALIVSALETKVVAFGDFSTDIESLTNQTTATAAKDAKAVELKTAITAVMTRAELKYGTKSPKYKKFGANAISRLTDSNLYIAGKRVVRTGTILLTELSTTGLTAAMLTTITTLCNDFETLLVEAGIKVAERDIEQEDRVEKGNVIYAELIKYTNTGQAIWSATDVAKYNDYVVYNTVTGTAEVVPPVPAP